MKKKIGNILPLPVDKCNLSFKNLAAFTLAEILLSLTVIGIVAAIALPSLLGNANERAWETQKKALYTRFSQALPLLPSLNGYGTLEGTLSSNSDDGEQHVDTDTAAETFIRDGLSKVMKITNICAIPEGKDGDEAAKILSDCGLPDKITNINGNKVINLSDMIFLSSLNPILKRVETNDFRNYEHLDTKAAAIETANGESILVYYNPDCEPDLNETTSQPFLQKKVCANFVYDLNGKKGPNTVGKDVGVITAIYSTEPVVVSPNPFPGDNSKNLTYEEAAKTCRESNLGGKMPNREELVSLVYNKILFNMGNGGYWSSSYRSQDNNWCVSRAHGNMYIKNKTDVYPFRCIKK